MNNFKYYYNNVPGKGLCRNNLIYTSLINEDATEFCMWFHNDSEYHKGHNEVVDPALMEMKYHREKEFLLWLDIDHKQLIPRTTRFDPDDQKIYFEIQGVDFGNRAMAKHILTYCLIGKSRCCISWKHTNSWAYTNTVYILAVILLLMEN